MGRMVDVDDLVDAVEVAALVGLSHRNSVYTYLSRYPSMPRPVVNLGRNRLRLWSRTEIVTWVHEQYIEAEPEG